MIKDNRYKISQEDIDVMRALRSEGYSYAKIATLFPVTAQTIQYWCDDVARKKQRLKNALREHKPLDKKRMARDSKKRRELIKDDRFKTRMSFQSAKDETRAKRKTARDYRTGKMLPMKKAIEILSSDELHLGNAKVE
ncbi:MAG: hypothetical protein Tp1123DCM1511741_39 [Prokaryotic dsDNA virus sp.]|nr:MAG: hypothetical protein Tp1123DCM1511741_39 [Prokaryotic dsDNA virus sp.]|tara:strand:- start:10951 stop:11364 length:414 start_codon:yes stop_codon:yes gene_type:complete